MGCSSKCVFCNQREITQSYENTESEVKKKISECSDNINEVAFYGGSFTGISLDKQRSLLQSVFDFITKNKAVVRISAYPEKLSDENILLLKEYNVRIVELGVQSLDKNVLEKSRRFYDPDRVEIITDKLKNHGFTIGHQVMLGLPGSCADTEYETIKKIIRMRPDFLRIYPVAVIKNTELSAMYERKEYTPISIDESLKRCVEILNLLEPTNIRVIRIGLHSDSAFIKDSLINTESYSESFGQLVKSDFIFSRIVKIINNSCNISKFNIKYHPNIFSLIYGLHNSYLPKYNNMNLNFVKDSSLPLDKIIIVQTDNCEQSYSFRIP